MNILASVSISMWVFALAYSFKHGNIVIPMLFGCMVFGLVIIALDDLGWFAKFVRWYKSN